MKLKRGMLYAAAVVLSMAVFVGCGKTDPTDTKEEVTAGQEFFEDTAGEMGIFKPIDCGLPAQDVYEYPFLGMTVRLSEEMCDRLESHDIFLYTMEDYAGENEISYAVMRFSVPSQEQKEEETMSVDIIAWEESMSRLGAIGVYQKNQIDQLDAITGCDTHKKLGSSTDGRYEYYLSTASNADEEFIDELEKSEVFIEEMHELDMNMGYSAFSADRIDGVENVGTFTTTDVQGNIYTEAMFADYDLTLVNVFATWCSPCVQEMPELEALRQEYEEKGVRLGIAAVVLDAKTAAGTDENAVQLAQMLAEKINAGFPFLIPDETDMNGRLVGIESVPESFFVDSEGNIVSDPYVGSNPQERWSQIVEKELAALRGGNE